MDEWVRVTKTDGELRLIVPNIEWAAQKILKGEVDNDVLNVLYGAQTYDENAHMNGFTPAILEQKLKDRGFKRIDVELLGYNLCMRAWKNPPKNLPSLGTPPNGHKTKRKMKPKPKRK